MNIICPNCQTQYQIESDKYVHQYATCKKCNHRFKVIAAVPSDSSPQETQFAAVFPQETQLAEPAPGSEDIASEDKQSPSPQQTQLAPSETPKRKLSTPQATELSFSENTAKEADKNSVTADSIAGPQKSRVSEILGAGSECFITEHQDNNQSMSDWRIGDVLLELYEIKGILGEGQFGQVFQVRHRGWNMDLALKAPKPQALAAGYENIEKEAETWVNLDLHPNIVNCYYVRRIAGIPQIFSEYVDGGDLKELITSKRLYQGDDEKVLLRMLDIAIQFAWGLHYAHEQGLIHQDIKPANVMVTSRGVIKITDFGLAKAGAMADISDQENNQTMVIAGMGMTPAYASPEQLAGKQLTRRTDLWSWGVCILEMILGYCSWEAGAVAPGVFEAYRDNALDDEPLITKIPEQLAQLLDQCFQEQAEKRPKNLQEVAEKLIVIYCDSTDHHYPRQQPKTGHGTASSLNNQAISLLDLGKTIEAKNLWESALKIDPRHYESNYNTVLYNWKNHGLEEAQVLAKIEALNKTEGQSARSNHSLARLYLQFGFFDETIRILNNGEARTTELPPDLTDAASKELGLAFCAKYRLADRNFHWDFIVQCLKKAVGLKITDPYTTTAYTLALQRDGEKRGASEFFKAVTSVGVIPKQFKQAVALFLPGYEVLYRLPKKHITTIEFIDDGENLLFSQGKQLIIWSLKNNHLLRQMDGHVGQITSVTISPDGKHIISGSDQGEIRIWDYDNGDSLQVWSAHKGRINALTCSSCGRFLITASIEKLLCLWDMDTGSRISAFYGAGHDAEIMDVDISPSGQKIVSASNDKVLRIWDISSGRTDKILSGHKFGVGCVRWIDDEHILSGAQDKTLKLWKVSDGENLRTFKGHTGTINTLKIARNKNYALTGSSDGHVRYWNLDTGTSRTVSQFSGPITAIAIDDSEQFSLAVTRSGIALFETCNPFIYQAPYLFSEPESASEVDKLQRRYQKHLAEAKKGKNQGDYVLALEILDQARSLKGYQRDFSAFKHWSELYLTLPKLKLKDVWDFAEIKQHKGRVTALVMSTLTNRLYSASMDQSILQWDVESRQSRSLVPTLDKAITNIDITPDGTVMLVSYAENLKVLDIDSGQELCLFAHHPGHVSAAVITADGRFALSSDNKGTLYLWRLLTGELISNFSNEKYAVTTMAVTPDGQYFVTGHRNNNLVSIHDMQSGQVVTDLDEHDKVVTSIAISSNSRYILSGSADATLRLWQIQSSRKKSVRVFRGHTKRIYQVAMDFQGKIAISASEDKTVRIWDMVNGECLFCFHSIESDFTSCAISLDGAYAFAGHVDGTVSIWCMDWILDKKTYSGWDNEANVYLMNYLKSHSITEPHKELKQISQILDYAGFGWLDKNEARLKLLELSHLHQSNTLAKERLTHPGTVEHKSNNKTNYYAILSGIIAITLTILFFNEPNGTAIDDIESVDIERPGITNDSERQTVDKMLEIAVLLARLNRHVMIINNRVDQHSLIVPQDIKQLRQMLKLQDSQLIDAWGHEFQYRGLRMGALQGRIILRSAGHDQKYKTDDDLLLNGFPYMDSLEVKRNNHLLVKLSSYLAENNMLTERQKSDQLQQEDAEQERYVQDSYDLDSNEELETLERQSVTGSVKKQEFINEESEIEHQILPSNADADTNTDTDSDVGIEIKSRNKVYVDNRADE